NPGAIDMVGDAAYPVAYFGRDSGFLYFRLRVNADAAGTRGFAQNAWVALLQTPTGNAFQYQYALALNGNGADDDFGNTGGQRGDTVEIHQNTSPEDFLFSGNFNDPAE